MEYLQGRALTNAIGNLDILDGYYDALKKLGHELEEIAEQVFLLQQIWMFYLFFFKSTFDCHDTLYLGDVY